MSGARKDMTMHNRLLLALPLALLAVPAAAQDATGTVAIDGSVAGRCLFTTPNQTISLGEMSLSGSDSTAGRLDTSRVDGRNATLVGWCNNAAAGMTVEAFALTNTATTATGFTNRVDYTATASANTADATDSSLADGSGSTATVGLFSGDVLVTLSDASAPGNGLLVAGDYDGRVEVTLTPTFTPPL